MVAFEGSGIVNLTASVVEDNRAYSARLAYGGGVYLDMTASTFRDVQIRGNRIDFFGSLGWMMVGLGAGLYAELLCLLGAMEGVVVEANVIDGGTYSVVNIHGGGIYWDVTSGRITCTRCEVRGNKLLQRSRPTDARTSYGAGLRTSGHLTLNATLISDNLIYVVCPRLGRHTAVGAGTVLKCGCVP